ncbi:MAG: hypothetical protein B6U73_01200 [Desulfurococcales archaeon ex4484_204]|nr:MAG: hypothetical protein B6U73_01200 [Desulfurococcales archaeon ex4484_204]
MLASGKIIRDYRALIKYLEMASKDLKEMALPSSTDLEYVRVLVTRRPLRLYELMEDLKNIVKERLDPDISRRAVAEVLNIDVSAEEAVEMIAKELAGWILEVAERLGILKLRMPW